MAGTKRVKMRGVTSTPMYVGEACLITITRDRHVDPIGALTVEDLTGDYVGVVVDYDPETQRVRAIFQDDTLVADERPEVRALDGRQPPFAYSVRPISESMQGRMSSLDVREGETCMIRVRNWLKRPNLLRHDTLDPHQVASLVPEALMGRWEARLVRINQSSGFTTLEGQAAIRAVAILTDERIREHEDDRVRHWHGKEVPVIYTVHPYSQANQALIEAEQFGRDVKGAFTGWIEELTQG